MKVKTEIKGVLRTHMKAMSHDDTTISMHLQINKPIINSNQEIFVSLQDVKEIFSKNGFILF